MDVLTAIQQRRHNDVNDVQPVEQVLSERALLDHVAQIAIGGRDDAHIDDAPASIGADLLQLTRLEKTQQQALHAKCHLAHFVQEDRSHVGRLELARLVAVRACEAALHVTKQFGFEQRLRQAGAVNGREDVTGAGAARVNRAGHDLLADSAFARDQNLRVRSGNAVNLLLQRCDFGAPASQLNMRTWPYRTDWADSRAAAFSDTINHCS